jgi:superfamily II DNA or RNA helicase
MTSREIIQSQALKKTENYKRCGLGISMGVGKTRIAIQHLQKNYNPLIRVLVVTPTIAVQKSWTDELEKMNLTGLSAHITFSTYISITKHNPDDYDIVYLDECHSLLESHEPFLSMFKGKILGLTGTPPIRKTTEKYRMVQKYCPIVFKFSVDEATEQSILNDYQIVVHMLELSKVNTMMKQAKTGNKWYTSEVADYLYLSGRVINARSPKDKQFSSIMRMKALMDYKTKEDYVKTLLQNVSTKCIVFANTQKQADKICQHSYHSANPMSAHNLELFSDGRISKLSCVLQLNEGITIPNLKAGIIMHAYGNERKTSQRIGRLLRLNPDEKATCHILCYKNTVDEKWVEDALKDLDAEKIRYYNPLID